MGGCGCRRGAELHASQAPQEEDDDGPDKVEDEEEPQEEGDDDQAKVEDEEDSANVEWESEGEHEEDEEAAATEEGESKGEHEGVGADGDAELPVSLMTLFSSLSPYRPVCLLLRTSSGSWPNRKMPQRRRMSLPSNGPLVKGQSDHSASEWLREQGFMLFPLYRDLNLVV